MLCARLTTLERNYFHFVFQYSVEMWQYYSREDFLGHLSQQILQPPLIIRTYNKDLISHTSTLVKSQLPPRISLRYLASHRFLAYFVATLAVAYCFGIRPFWFTLYLIMGWFLFLVVVAAAKPWMKVLQTGMLDPVSRPADDSMHDVSI